MPYDPRFVQPMREELTQAGIQELKTAADVDKFLAQTSGTAMIVVNSVCGCAAGAARPAVTQAIKGAIKPDRVATVFAGQDLEAVDRARFHFTNIPPSSPSIALFKEGKLVHFVHRHNIEGRDAASLAADLKKAFEKHCATVTK
ncbi:MAG: BrxA/BrxB family bacilliredoxin [Planctomycetes bacterium]|nr:BrxA/BrxB family bacilliredoxin [Planctomycetota bacterium]MBI3843572.1 BrxA/BrxB family bacilliredoxin [Planctomycetota bacterium]